MNPVSLVHVVVPAHDEERRIGRCVRAVGAAVDALRAHRPEVVVTASVVLDRCTDDTAGRALAHAGRLGWRMLVVDAGAVGAARRHGVARAASRATAPASETWVACTDADSAVSESWLVDHVDLARQHDLVVGRVRPDPDELSVAALTEWHRRHRRGGPHVHGANLGIRMSTYLAVGGFAPVAQHEDVRLVEAAVAGGARWTEGSMVTTSARSVGRAPGGFSAYVRGLEGDVRRGPIEASTG